MLHFESHKFHSAIFRLSLTVLNINYNPKSYLEPGEESLMQLKILVFSLEKKTKMKRTDRCIIVLNGLIATNP